MRYIKPVDDFVAPGVVTLVNEVTLRQAPEYNEYACYGLTAIGYIAGGLGYGGNFVKNLGVASLPLSIHHLLTRLGVEKGVSRQRMAYRPAHASSYSPIRQTTVPEFEDVRVS